MRRSVLVSFRDDGQDNLAIPDNVGLPFTVPPVDGSIKVRLDLARGLWRFLRC